MPPTWMPGFLPSVGAGKASFRLFSLQDHKAISEVFSAGRKYLQNTINNRQNSAVLGSSGGSTRTAGSRGSPAPSHCSGHTPGSPFSTPQMLPGYFFHHHLAQVEAGTGEHLSHRLEGGHSARKGSQTSSWHGKGWRKGKKLLLLVSDLNVPELMARQGHCPPCAAMKTMLESSNPTAAFHSICSWKLLRFSLPLLVSCHSRSPARSPSRGCIFLPGLPSLMSESFHLTKSLLGRVSPVSLHLCQGPFHTSEHFNDIWCWDGGEAAAGGRRKPNTIHSQAECMARSWKTTGW